MMRSVLVAIVLSAFVLRAAFAAPRDAGASMVDVTGEVTLVESSSARAQDASQVVIWLVPLRGTTDSPADRAVPKAHYRMLQHNKTFEPKLLVVPLGSIVDFPNLDPWFHNVFSLYQGKRFDLGLYQARAEKAVTFDRPGPSFLFCNIHPHMTAVILTVNSELFAISNKAGRIFIPHVPPGQYALHVWYENAASESTDPLQRGITIGPGESVLPPIAISVANHDSSHSHDSSHKDKYGYDYDPKASSPAY
jgi:plastocyanin